MSLVHRLGVVVHHFLELARHRLLEAVLHILLEGSLIALEGQHIVPSLIHDLLGYLPLASHGIDGHDAAGYG